jgi:condensin complex subunit 1
VYSRLSKLDLELARYTCIALQRLNGSAKKVKGSLKDDTVRYPMTSPIFLALSKAVERPCRSLDWFGLAEHVVNTVYALGQRPDEWCGNLIRRLAARAFGPRENTRTADNFEMSQLFFVVGHVALKQIVFLELVEREWKRQKDEMQANAGQSNKDKDGEELDQVAGNAEDEIGDRIQAIREVEILYGEQSLLAAYAQMIVRVCGSPQIFKVCSMTLRYAIPLKPG